MKPLRIAIIGTGFGAEFIPIYKAFDKTECYALCRRNKDELNKIASHFGIEKQYTDYRELLKDSQIDAVHINSPIADHAWMAIEALKAGKHVASTVPMAITTEECLEITRLEAETGLVYMMMETAVYTREYLYVKNLVKKGSIGDIQFLRGSHQQNMSLPGWPAYWYGMPPMYYGTHAIGPLADLLDLPISTVRCYGSGRIRKEYKDKYDSAFAVESAQLTFTKSDITAEVTRSLFDTVRQYRESFDVYGTRASFEWEQLVGEKPILYTGYEDAERVEVPDTDKMLPPEIARFALSKQIFDDQHVSFIQGAGHGGSHPHLVNEFVSAILEKRKAHVCATRAANWTMAGILAHQSAIQGGKTMEL